MKIDTLSKMATPPFLLGKLRLSRNISLWEMGYLLNTNSDAAQGLENRLFKASSNSELFSKFSPIFKNIFLLDQDFLDMTVEDVEKNILTYENNKKYWTCGSADEYLASKMKEKNIGINELMDQGFTRPTAISIINRTRPPKRTTIMNLTSLLELPRFSLINKVINEKLNLNYFK